MNKLPEHTTQEHEHGQEVRAEPFPAIDPPAGISAGIAAEDQALQEKIKHLLATCGRIRTPKAVYELLRDLLRIAPRIEKAEGPEGETTCLEAMRGQPTFFEPETKDVLRELLQHCPEDRRQILEAATKQARTRAHRATRLGRMEDRFGAAVAGLDGRTKAILRIVSDAEDVDGEINSDFLNTWKELAREWPVKPLRGDPAAAELLAIHDLILLLDEARSGEPQPIEEDPDQEASEEKPSPAAIAAEPGDEGPRLQLEKAAGEFRAVVRWLQARTLSEKVTAMAYGTFINGDISSALQGRGLYDGDLAKDLDGDWEDAITAILEDPQCRESTLPELTTIAAYVMGLEAANY
jgi:hypothetical protein